MTEDYIFNRDILAENMGFPPPNKKENKEQAEAYQKWKPYIEMKMAQQVPPFLDVFGEGKINTVATKTKKMIRKGIPPEFRGIVWFSVSGARKAMKKHPKKYQELLAEANDVLKNKTDSKKMEHMDYIQNDLQRTFPELGFFQGKKELDRLKNILIAYSIHNPSIGYCQGMNFVAGCFLYFMNDEEKAFWTLEVTLRKYLPHDMYDPSLNGVYMESYVLYRLVKERRKSVHEIFKKLGFEENEYAIFCTSWFMCLFITILPIETSLRVMDCFLLEGNKVLFRVAITLLSIGEKDLRRMKHKGEVISFLKNHCLGLYDAGDLLRKSFKIRNFSKQKLAKLRKEYKELHEGKQE